MKISAVYTFKKHENPSRSYPPLILNASYNHNTKIALT